jgi:nitrate reductase delta subunit
MASRPTRRLLRQLGELLAYPSAEHDLEAAALARHADIDCPAPAASLHRYAELMAQLERGEREAAYTRTFDVTPRCIPYVSVHLFGEESFDRARLMTGLVEAYERIGFDDKSELPDHLRIMLIAGPYFGDDEWGELVDYCLLGAVRAMLASLGEESNPYVDLLAAIWVTLCEDRGLSAGDANQLANRSLMGSRTPARAIGGCSLRPAANQAAEG